MKTLFKAQTSKVAPTIATKSKQTVEAQTPKLTGTLANHAKHTQTTLKIKRPHERSNLKQSTQDK